MDASTHDYLPRGVQVGSTTFVIGDGAMATYLHQCGVPIRVCAEELNLSSPTLVEDVHRAYVQAGATLIQTNTFGANRTSLERHGLADKVSDINHAAVVIARRAAAQKACVYGTIGPIQGGLRYGSALSVEERQQLTGLYREQAEALFAGGIDGWVLETFPDLEELLVALEVVRSLSQLPIVANLSPEEIGVTRDGVPLDEAFSRLRAAGADVTGLNCRLGPYGILRSYEQLARHDGPLAAVPNGGMLHRADDERLTYTGDEDNFADVMVEIARLGVTWLGGCCGTTPNHVRTLVERLRMLSDEDLMQRAGTVVGEASRSPITLGDDGRLPYERILPSSESLIERVKTKTTIIVELDPPKTLDCDRFLQGARALRAAGADMITMADNSLGTVRVSNMALAGMLKQFGIEPLVHVTCRDRNLIGQQSHLMGLHVLGVRHVLLITGDPSRYGDLPGATSVYDVSSIDLTKMVRRLNDGVSFSGKPLKRPAEFVIGTAFNPHVRNFEKAVERLKRKVEAGADYVMTQPVYDERTMEQVASATRDLGVPVMIGVMPLTSLRNAEFLHHQVPGITIPDHVLERMRDVSVEEAPDVGFEIARELCDTACRYFRGIYLVTPFLKYDVTVRLTKHIRTRAAEPVV
ncbi:bifunctional homocysteine S-methyltransferase/methylenetetrahydrofolate reductase [Alicyclobacillus fastidiosus]|uniref:Bifunctional homocysteine S-methyltransferase/methylenetetrahydrofolate reductase n=1 Tax=Alicyclobacillus fastidiosus TaxID=392011 RepID=A0ABY6ZBF0_9BACL|nr:bifunctional homocysteine S-methyltransferase/methylenetetrahydrofolate reductase [Alicyclobacillus fastidiosus]WAH40093.1 bifunctional homocysteine S-methyltransferase/methylenetetrahydrofolate reductase [Alicyclobacillus fastidiosus]GMA61418.1 bifunctional homocysteine S-methyltransferase/methylenetetrahydrofolate reductase [Alicyclobacillus fastidiosus]